LPHPTRLPIPFRSATPQSKSCDGALLPLPSITQRQSTINVSRPSKFEPVAASRRRILFLAPVHRRADLWPRHRRVTNRATKSTQAHLPEMAATALPNFAFTCFARAAAQLRTSTPLDIPHHRSESTFQTACLPPGATGSAVLRFSCQTNFVSRDFLGSCAFRATPAHANLQSPRRNALNNVNVSLMRPEYGPFVEQRPSSSRIHNKPRQQYYRIYLRVARQYRDFLTMMLEFAGQRYSIVSILDFKL
jgi:hypothetical protein